MTEQQNEGLRDRYNVLEKEFDSRIDALGIEYSGLINKVKFDQALSTYCKMFVQSAGQILSVRMMVPSEYGFSPVLLQKIDLIFMDMFPNYEFR